MPDESNAGTIVNSIRALEDHIILCGMEGAFSLITSGAAFGLNTLNMLQHPGRVNSDIVNTWCKASLILGVPRLHSNGDLEQHPLCPHDRTNMLWSADAVLNSCTEILRQDLKLVIPPEERTGPTVLMALFQKLYRPSLANNKALLDKLDNMNIRTYPGENVTLFVQDAVKLVRELQMNFMSDDAMPELTLTALSGLRHLPTLVFAKQSENSVLPVMSMALDSPLPLPFPALMPSLLSRELPTYIEC
jgi:hypothetical protein